MIAELLKDHPVHAVDTDFWVQVSTPEDIKKAEEALKQRRKK